MNKNRYKRGDESEGKERMNNIQVFNNSEFGSIRTVEINKEPFFVAKDVAEILGYRDTSDAIKRHVDEDDKLTRCFADSGQNREMYIINESGLYSLILSSKLPKAKEFKRWVTSEILPTIRKHGAYMTTETVEKAMNDPDFIIGLVTKLKEERTAKEQALKKIEEDKPKVLFADAVATSHTSILIGELAKILRANGINIGQNRLFDWLRKNHYLITGNRSDRNIPQQWAMDMNLFEIKESTHLNGNGAVIVSKTPKITGKGQSHFINGFLSGRFTI